MKKLSLFLVTSLVLALIGASAAGAAPKQGHTGLANPKVAMLLELQHPGGLNRFVRRVSDPTDPLYRHYSTVEQLVARYGAKPKVTRRVTDWFTRHGVRTTLSPTHTFVTAELPTRRADRLLPPAPGAATASSAGAGLRPRTVPAALRGAVARVSVGSDLPVHTDDAIGPAPAAEAEGGTKGKGNYGSILFHTGTASGCAAAESGEEFPLEPFTPNQYLTAYGDTTLHSRGLTGKGERVAVVEQGGFKRSDIEAYDRCFGIKKTPPTSVEVITGAKRPAAEDETTLDLEQLSVAAPGLDHIYVYEASEDIEGIVLAAGNALGNPGSRPNVISISLGLCEPQVHGGALAWRDALDGIFAVAGGSGISVLVSSGDQGSSGCRGVDTETGAETGLPIQAVSLPSSSPYVTAVGGTNLSLTKSNHIHDEIVWNDSWIDGKPGIPWSGAGGVSIISPRTPWWQAGVHGFGPGRKVPDIAALADRYPGYAFYCTAAACKGGEKIPGWSVVGGTSAATPLTAAGIALIDQAAEQSGQPDLGFLNPLIYQVGYDAKTRKAAFFDVTTGDDDIWPALSKLVVGQPYGCCSARPGYDWASGWGSLKIPAFEQLALAAYKPAPMPVAKSGGSAR
ncbi:MAG TPA: S53 family peptidase [Solirubrobacterales bacterium]|nr:S53 family peptidase [Solirubrobacterales bacterium]